MTLSSKREDLEDLLREPAYFHAIFHSDQRVKALYEAQTELETANEAIANHNLAMRDRLYQLRSETQAAFDEAKRLEVRWSEIEKEQRELYQRLTPQFFLMRLKHATTAQDDQSEALASAFVNASSDPASTTNKDIDDFVSEFRNMRKVYHKRVMWSERWANGKVRWVDD